jgi:hypothetical protein
MKKCLKLPPPTSFPIEEGGRSTVFLPRTHSKPGEADGAQKIPSMVLA